MRQFLSLAVLSMAGLWACGAPVSPKEVAHRTGVKAATLLREANESARSMNQSTSVASLVDSLNVLRAGFNSVPLAGGSSCAPGSDGCYAPIPLAFAHPAAPASATVDDATTQLVEFLENRVFTDENLESSAGGSAIFFLSGDDVCTDGKSAPAPACLEQVDRMELRVRATPGPNDAMDLTVLIGPDRREPLTFKVRDDSLAVVLDLGEVRAAAEFLAAAEGQSNPLPLMSGELELGLRKNADQDFTLGLSVLKDVSIVATDASGATRSFLTTTAAPAAAMRLEGAAKRLTVDVNVGLTEYSFPYRPDISRVGAAGARMTYHLAGFSFGFAAEEGQQNFVVGHLGFGAAQSYAVLDGKTLITADLNRVSGRHFDINLERGTDGLPIVRVHPGLELVTGFFLAPLAIDGDVSVPPQYANETYALKLQGSDTPAVRPLAPNPASGFPGGLKVLSGKLTLETDRPGVAPVVVPAGACLVDRDVPALGAHPLLGHFEVSPCP
jgi:hypothetical protein